MDESVGVVIMKKKPQGGKRREECYNWIRLFQYQMAKSWSLPTFPDGPLSPDPDDNFGNSRGQNPLGRGAKSKAELSKSK